MKKIKEQAEFFQAMHKCNAMFVLPNIWDAGSAVVFEKANFKAIATTSAGIAYSLGYKDGEDITLDDLIVRVKEITKRISIPLSVDFERGYGETPELVKLNAKRLVEAGAVGFNIEDGEFDGTLSDIPFQVAKIKALVELQKELDVPFVINARTCTYWLDVPNKLAKAIKRGNAYAQAGANCIFIPGAIAEDEVKALTQEINAPINIIANGKFNDFKKLDALGVRRLSIGSGAVRAVYGNLIDIAADLTNDNIEKMVATPFTYTKANNFFNKK